MKKLYLIASLMVPALAYAITSDDARYILQTRGDKSISAADTFKFAQLCRKCSRKQCPEYAEISALLEQTVSNIDGDIVLVWTSAITNRRQRIVDTLEAMIVPNEYNKLNEMIHEGLDNLSKQFDKTQETLDHMVKKEVTPALQTPEASIQPSVGTPPEQSLTFADVEWTGNTSNS